MKFGTQEHILVLDDGHVIKYEHLKLKMADARHFKNSFLAMSIVWFQWNFAQRSRIAWRWS